MNSLRPSQDLDPVTISLERQDWSPTQPWLTETIRTVTTALYAETSEGNSIKTHLPIHQKAIAGQIGRAFGPILTSDQTNLNVFKAINILIDLGDFGDVGHGYCIPRESRVARLVVDWGRIAGGLPLPYSEHSEDGVESSYPETVGRIVKLAPDFDVYDHGSEHSDVYAWISKSPEQILELLNQDLRDQCSSESPQDTVVFYNVGVRNARTRRDRWQTKAPPERFVVARTTRPPIHYFICFSKRQRSGWHWFAVTNDEGRKWLLLTEREAGVINTIRGNHVQSGVYLRVPDMLPGAWMRALLASATSALKAEQGLDLLVSGEVLPLVRAVLKSANIEII
jgi:hypothetical protein